MSTFGTRGVRCDTCGRISTGEHGAYQSSRSPGARVKYISPEEDAQGNQHATRDRCDECHRSAMAKVAQEMAK